MFDFIDLVSAMLNFKHLLYFRTVAKTGAINRAAEKLHLTPQTLSGQVGCATRFSTT